MIFVSLNAQNNKARWNDLFSYNNVNFLEEVNGVIYCGSENGIFLFNPQNPTADWIKFNKTNFLNNVSISAMAYDKASDSFLVGYENGGIDLLKSGESTMVLDIRWNNFEGSKKVNNIYIHNGIAFIAGAFGIVSYDIAEEEFKETTRTTFVVNDITIAGETIYLATSAGVRSSTLQNNLNNPNINSWTVVNTGLNITNIEYHNNDVFYSYANNLRSINGIVASYNTIKKLKSSNGQLVITQDNQVSVLNGNSYTKTAYSFNDAIFFNNKIYAGSLRNGITDLSSIITLDYKPQGPYTNRSYSVTAQNSKVWIAPGGIENFNNVTFNADGFSYFDTKNWNHYSSESLLNAKDIIKIAVDPTDENHFIAIPYAEVTYWGQMQIGIFEFESNKTQPTHIIDPLPKITRFGGGSFDSQGNFYLSQGLFCDAACMASGTPNYNALNFNISSISVKTKTGGWITKQRENLNVSNALSPIIDDKYIYIPQARRGGLAVLRKDNYEAVGTILNTGEQTLPTDNVWSAALDKTGNLWIGTNEGLAVTYGIESAVDNGVFAAEPIVIVQDGIPEALLTDVGIYGIKVDNANRKWLATNGAGVYYVSENGEETKYHFTTKNSPLPSDIVYDVTIDESNGKVYFSTEKGVVSYNGDVSTESTNFSQTIAYPNPVRPTYRGNVTIKNLPNRALVKITDVVGNLLFERTAQGGIVEWTTNNSKGSPVASGIYLVLMTNEDGTETKTLKIAVVR